VPKLRGRRSDLSCNNGIEIKAVTGRISAVHERSNVDDVTIADNMYVVRMEAIGPDETQS